MKKMICLLLMFCSLSFAEQIPLELEFARTEQERAFGLMQRKSLGENQGMLFIYPHKQYGNVWMFNCLIDLSIAFLDSEGIIREIKDLKAYPEKMEGTRIIANSKELEGYNYADPVAQFFYNKRVTSSFLASFALEMNAGWFYNHHILPGDKVIWDEKTGKGHIEITNIYRR